MASTRTTKTLPQSPWLRKLAGSGAQELLGFCRQHDLLVDLKNAASLAEECFGSPDLKLEKEIDPETGDSQIVISLSIRNESREKVLAAYRTYRKRLIKAVPWPERGFIRLSYDLI